MIEKKRLEELIEKGATIYEVKYSYKGLYVDEFNLKNIPTYYKSRLDFFQDMHEIFETKEEAEWHKEFGCIERTERLELPTWEEFKNKKIKQVCFIGGDTICFFELYEDEQNNRLILLDHDCDYEYFNEEITKENYTLACRKAKELFLGENK